MGVHASKIKRLHAGKPPGGGAQRLRQIQLEHPAAAVPADDRDADGRMIFAPCRATHRPAPHV
jgi:hypothetical protein